MLSRSVIINSLQSHGLQPTRLLYPQSFPGKNIGAGCHFLLRGIFLTQGSNLRHLWLLHWQAGSSPGKPSYSFTSLMSLQVEGIRLRTKDSNSSTCKNMNQDNVLHRLSPSYPLWSWVSQDPSALFISQSCGTLTKLPFSRKWLVFPFSYSFFI